MRVNQLRELATTEHQSQFGTYATQGGDLPLQPMGDLTQFFSEIQTKTMPPDGMALESVMTSIHEPKMSQRGKSSDPGATVNLSKQAIALFLKKKRFSNNNYKPVDDEK